MKLRFSCPKCGAPCEVDDAARSHACTHCGSLLLLEAPQREEIFVVDAQVRSPADVLALVIEYRLEAYRAELRGRFRDAQGQAPPEILFEAQVRAFEARLRTGTRIAEAASFQVPYWHLAGTIVQAILGRHRDGPKLVRLRGFGVEHSVPAYDVGQANLRDRGLRLGEASARPLLAADLEARGPFLPWRPATQGGQGYREIDKWRMRDLDRAIEPVVKHGEFLFGRRLLVYRPYWLARVIGERAEWVLVDASFGTIAGHPDELEARALLAQAVRDPLGSSEAHFRNVHALASRCPDCGAEQLFEPSHCVVVCPSCQLALRAEPGGIRMVACDHAKPHSVPSTYLPFWRFDLSPDEARPASVAEFARQWFTGTEPAGLPRARQLWVPAFRLLETEAGDEALKALLEAVHASEPELAAGKVPLGSRAAIAGASLSEGEAAALGRFALFAALGAPAAARLNATIVRQWMGLELKLQPPRLAFLPFEDRGDLLGFGTAQFPRWLLEAPERAAQRVNVQQALAAGSTPP